MPLAVQISSKKASSAHRARRAWTEAIAHHCRRSLRQPPHRSQMYVTAVQIAEFLIMVVILMSLPKLVTS